MGIIIVIWSLDMIYISIKQHIEFVKDISYLEGKRDHIKDQMDKGILAFTPEEYVQTIQNLFGVVLTDISKEECDCHEKIEERLDLYLNTFEKTKEK